MTSAEAAPLPSLPSTAINGEEEAAPAAEEEEEEEDVDFNPFLLAPSPSSPSSSSSSSSSDDDPPPYPPPQTHTHPPDSCEDSDAICRRTRARHSLADRTLDELEAFLQESDHDDDPSLPPDDEAEYRRFLAGVLLGSPPDPPHDDDDDADFELEIGEALESSDDDDRRRDRRPETRRKPPRNPPAAAACVPLRPILPSIVAGAPPPHGAVPVVQGFSVVQIGQLYCLIEEHVQLLMQIFSLCVLDPARRHVSASLRQLVVEMAERRREALARRSTAYPSTCFENLHMYRAEQPHCCPEVGCSSAVLQPVRSVLDVAGLGLARGYLEDVSVVVSSYRASQVEGTAGNSLSERVPLFVTQDSELSNEAAQGNVVCQDVIASSPESNTKPKKSLAAVLVENTKKQAIAFVPKCIADLAQRFAPVFNPAMFPRKPPLSTIANRVLFTDNEDGLLAMGIMEYNHDWEAIKLRFLPCKSTNQIFVRQKNRSSSSAPENPIKAVRRMKTSPLNASEMALISKGLKAFKNDWNSVWKFLMPYRDPSILPRQWRIACGTQKSYRKSETVKEKRRLYEASRRRKNKNLMIQQASAEKDVYENGHNSADDDLNADDEAYIHEAFLAVSYPGYSKPETTSNQVCVMPQIHSAVKVVKLAPGLPPVNLPPSVRVISQSAFKNYHGVPSYLQGKERNLSVGNGTVRSKQVSSDLTNVDLRAEPSGRLDPRITEESQPGSELMHPLLFQAPEDGYHEYYPNNDGSITSKTLNFFSRHLHRHNSHSHVAELSDRHVDSFPSTQSKELSSHVQTIDFHPLFRKTVNENSVFNIRFANNNGPDHSEHIQESCLPFYPTDDVACEPKADQGHLWDNSVSSQYERESDLDLDIHLCSTTSRTDMIVASHKSTGPSSISYRGNRTAGNTTVSSPSAKKDYHINAVIQQGINSKLLGSGLIRMTLPRDAVCRSTANNVEDEFLKEIIMEQEELSDTDEDVGDVEFECEEMDDSEEELDSEDLATIPNQEGASAFPHRTEINFQSFRDCGKSSTSIQLNQDPRNSPSSSLRPKRRVALKGHPRRGSQASVPSHDSSLRKRNSKGSKTYSLKRPELCLGDTECTAVAAKRHRRDCQ